MKHCHTTKDFRGFTVLEMLIATVVIAILAMILVPVLKGAKNRAKQVQCMSNLQALYVMWTQKRGEDSYILSPSAGNRLRDSEWPAGYLAWARANGADTNLFVCPADPKPFQSPVVLVTQHSGSAWIGAIQFSYALEEPVLAYPWDKTIKDVPNPRVFDRKSAAIYDYNRWSILINSNQTATLTLVSGGYVGSNNGGMAALWDLTRTNQIAPTSPSTMEITYEGSMKYKFAKNGAVFVVPTMASSYGYNYVDVTTYTNQCSFRYESPIQVLGWPDDAQRAVLLMDYPVSFVRCALCYGYYVWQTPTALCAYCGTNNITPKTPTPGPADNWDADAMGPLIGRHNGRCNVIFQDGSASSYKPAQIDPRANMWQIKFYINGTTTNRVTNRLWRTVQGEAKGWTYPSAPFQ